jgi:hypothetical protein
MPKTNGRVKSIIKLGEIVEECESKGILYNNENGLLIFEDQSGETFFAEILTNGKVSFTHLVGDKSKPYKYKNIKTK